MTDEQKYAEILKELAEILHEKNSTIWMQNYEIEQLKNKLAAAEQMCGENCAK